MESKRMPRSLTGLLAASVFALACGQAQAKGFTGFNEQFNLGRSGQSGAVCSAKRDFDDPLGSTSARVWDVTCRGWSQKLGRIYLFEHAKGREEPAAWRTALSARANCSAAQPSGSIGLSGATTASCKSVPDKLDYVVLSAQGRKGVVIAEGMSPISDILATGLKFVAGSIGEPPAIAEQNASVSQVAGDVSELAALVKDKTNGVDSLREEAFRRNQDWRFGDAEDIFAELAGSTSTTEPEAVRIEAAYNFALNVSNEGRFSEADIYFRQADDMALKAGLEPAMRGLALNYKAAHARNEGHYQDAARLAEDAIAARRETVASTAVSETAGLIKISDPPSRGFSTFQLTSAQRAALLDVQAMQIEATSDEVLGHDDQARQVLQRAVAILNRPIFDEGSAQANAIAQASGRGAPAVLTLGAASPWLNTRVKADVLRLDRNVGNAAQSTPQLQAAIDAFQKKYPNSLPLAEFLVELARSEAAAGQDDKALADYETAFSIFRDQRGALGDTAKLVGTYFDILLRRIGDNPAAHPQEVERYFIAAQTLAAQASAEAAKRQAARVMSGNTVAAGLARALDDTTRSIQAKQEEIRDLRQRGTYLGDLKAKKDAELAELVRQNLLLEQQLLQADPKYASSLRNVVQLADLQKALRPGEVYAKIFVLSNRSYGLVITPTSVHPYAIELAADQAGKMVDDLRKPMDRIDVNPVLGRYDVALAHEAFDKLFGPVRSDILAAKLIIYEPDATLLGVPIAALVVDDSTAVMKRNLDLARKNRTTLSYAGVHWLGAQTPSAVALSPSAFVEVRQAAASKAPDPFYGFADPQISNDPRAFSRVRATSLLAAASANYCSEIRQGLTRLEPLPQSAEEVKVVAQSFGQGQDAYSLGPAFTDKAVLTRGEESKGLSRYRVLYFATHGVLLPPNGCLQPALVTSLAPDGGDGLIDVNDIPQLKLDADIVVLSACNTGRNQGGDEAEGLVSTFVEAGARNVVVSNWSADSSATGELMTGMFAQKDVSQADALEHAQAAMMASPNEHSHPFYWAAFTVVGDGARPMPAG